MGGTCASTELIDRDLPCAHCGYNLRTLPSGGACPECATAVQQSIVAEGQIHPRYGRSILCEGRRWLITGALSCFGLSLAAATIGSIIEFVNFEDDRNVVGAVMAAGYALLGVCSWLITRYGSHAKAITQLIAWVARVSLLVAALLGFLIVVIAALEKPTQSSLTLVHFIWAINAVGTIAAFAWLAVLAWRLRRPALAVWSGCLSAGAVEMLRSTGLLACIGLPEADGIGTLLPDIPIFGPVWNHGAGYAFESREWRAMVPSLWLFLTMLTIGWFGILLLREARSAPRRGAA
jgi:hypothetical protein